MPYSSQNINDWISSRISKTVSKDVIVQSISDYYAHIRGMPTLQAKFLYLELIRSSPFYGSAFFKVEFCGYWKFEKTIFLMISNSKIEFVNETTKETLMVFNYDEIHHFDATEDNLRMTIHRPSTLATDDIGDDESYNFATVHADEIVSLIREYAPTKQLSTKERTYTDQDRVALLKDVEKTRASLLVKGLIRHPVPESAESAMLLFKQDSKTSRGSILSRTRNRMSKIMLSTESLKKSRESLSLGSMLNLDYSDADWSFSKTKLFTSIIASDTGVNYEDFAIRLNSVILKFSDLSNTADTTDLHPLYGDISEIFTTCIGDKRYANELYLQLIKMTTNHAETDSRKSLQCWGLMSMAVGVVAPASPLVLDYLKAHLRL